MGRLVYDHTRLREPNLLVPGRSPVGPVRSSVPIIAGWVAGRTFGCGAPRYHNGAFLEVDSVGNNLVGLGCTTDTGWGDTTPDMIELGDDSYANRCFGANPTTLVWVGRGIDSSNIVYMMSSGSVYYDELRFDFSVYTNNLPTFHTHDGTGDHYYQFNGIMSVSRLTTYVIVLTWDGSTTLTCYNAAGSQEKTATTGIFPSGSYPLILNVSQTATGNPAVYYGEKTHVKMAAAFPFRFSAAQAKRTIKDPYWFLEAA